MRCDAVFPVDFAFHFRRNVTHLSAVSGYTDILHRDVERAAGGEIRVGQNWRRLLGENDGSTGLLRFGDFRLRAELALANGLRLS
jgi:hypothetical protein